MGQSCCVILGAIRCGNSAVATTRHVLLVSWNGPCPRREDNIVDHACDQPCSDYIGLRRQWLHLCTEHSELALSCCLTFPSFLSNALYCSTFTSSKGRSVKSPIMSSTDRHGFLEFEFGLVMPALGESRHFAVDGCRSCL